MTSFPLVNRAFQGISTVYHHPVWNSKATIGKLTLYSLPIIGLFLSNPHKHIMDQRRALYSRPLIELEQFISEDTALQRESILFHVAGIVHCIATGFFIAALHGLSLSVGFLFGAALSSYHIFQLAKEVPVGVLRIRP